MTAVARPGRIPSGTTTEYDEGIDLDPSLLSGGAPSGDGGIYRCNPDCWSRQDTSESGGYVDSIGTPTASLKNEIEFIDTSIGQMVAELKTQHLINSTLIIITAKHGQSPVDSSRYVRDGSDDPATLLSSYLAPSENSAIGPTEDDVALLWLANSSEHLRRRRARLRPLPRVSGKPATSRAS